MKYYSQYKQDEFIDSHVFKGMRGGFFVEMGADDGIWGSNTIFFEKERGWKGLCIEPRAIAFAKLVKNRKCLCENVCISNDDGTKEFLEIQDDVGGQLSGLVENYDPKHVKRIQNEGGKAQTIEVECIRLNSLLEKHSVKTVDYFSLDIEGGELGILQSIDFDRVKINCISVENNYSDPRINKFLSSKGYRRLTKIKIDEIYALKGSGLDTYKEPLTKRWSAGYKGLKVSVKRMADFFLTKVPGKLYFMLSDALFSRYSFPKEFAKNADGFDTLLDAGCGPHSEVQNLKKIGRSLGLDLFEPSIEESKAAKIHDEYRLMDMRRIGAEFPAKSFDIVVSCDTIEHLTPDEGMRFLDDMESIAKKRVIVFTPNGFLHQDEYEGNILQVHKSGWTAGYMRSRGYRVIGINGWRALRTHGTNIRFKPRYVWEIISGFSEVIFARKFPQTAFQLFCVKDIEPAPDHATR